MPLLSGLDKIDVEKLDFFSFDENPHIVIIHS